MCQNPIIIQQNGFLNVDSGRNEENESNNAKTNVWIQIVLKLILKKTEEFYKDIADDVEKRFDTSNCWISVRNKSMQNRDTK